MTLVMVADDEPDILESTEQVLKVNGFDVATVRYASILLEALRRTPPDILLQDVNMPGLDLGAVMAGIRADRRLRNVRVLLFTASESAEETMHRIGAHGFIPKPFDAVHIKRLLEQALAAPLAVRP